MEYVLPFKVNPLQKWSYPCTHTNHTQLLRHPPELIGGFLPFSLHPNAQLSKAQKKAKKFEDELESDSAFRVR